MPPMCDQYGDRQAIVMCQTIGDFALEQREFKWDSDERLKQALEEYLVDRHRNTALPVFDAETASTEDQEKIQVVENRLIKEMGYCGHCAKVAMQKADAPTNRGQSALHLPRHPSPRASRQGRGDRDSDTAGITFRNRHVGCIIQRSRKDV